MHRLAIALWKVGDFDQALGLLDQAIQGISSFDPVRPDLLRTLAEILVEQSRWDRAAAIYRELLEALMRSYGSNHESTLSAKGDLAFFLFELGEAGEASELEREAWQGARNHLGTRHAVSCVLAWNYALRLEKNGDENAARAIMVEDLLWLLAEEDDSLETHQYAVKAMLAKRYGWQTAAAC